MFRLTQALASALLLLGVILLGGTGGAWADSGHASDAGHILQFVAYLRVDSRPLAAVRYHGDVRVVSEGDRLGDEFQVVAITEEEVRVRLLSSQQLIRLDLERASQVPSRFPRAEGVGVPASREAVGVEGVRGSPPAVASAFAPPGLLSVGKNSSNPLDVSKGFSAREAAAPLDRRGEPNGVRTSIAEGALPSADTLRRVFGVDQSRETPATVEEFLHRLQQPPPMRFSPKPGG